MRIRLTKPHGAYKRGEVIDLPDRQSESLIAWEYAVAARDDQRELVENARAEPAAETADAIPRRQKK
jgi:hypothetical protein